MPSYSDQISGLSEALGFLTDDERKELSSGLSKGLPLWVPLPGPQEIACNSPADILFFGGSGGGGKSDLLLGLALTRHHTSVIYRREGTQHQAMIDRMAEILRTRKGFSSQPVMKWSLPGNRKLEFGACPDPGDEQKQQGRPRDFIGFDEITHFLKHQFTFLIGWNRTTRGGQRCRVVCTGNPPQSEDGRWVIDYWGPWINPKHPKPAQPGELRWYTTIDGKEVECHDGTQFYHNGELITPKSRTFIPSSIDDNPFLIQAGYKSTLQALPEPLRSQILMGDFTAGIQDSEWQVLPTSWVEAAMDRWKPAGKYGVMDSIGADCSRGGQDRFVISTRYAHWYDELRVYPGKEVPDGPTGARLIILAMRDDAPIHVDVIGIGSSVFDALRGLAEGFQSRASVQVIGVNSSESAPEGSTDKATGKLKFRNMRSYIWWRFRESLDPDRGDNVALPPDPELKADLCAPLWMPTPGGILIEPKEDKIGADGVRTAGLKKRLGRSPDKGEAVVYCSMTTRKRVRKDQLPEIPNLARTYVPHLDPNKQR